MLLAPELSCIAPKLKSSVSVGRAKLHAAWAGEFIWMKDFQGKLSLNWFPGLEGICLSGTVACRGQWHRQGYISLKPFRVSEMFQEGANGVT